MNYGKDGLSMEEKLGQLQSKLETDKEFAEKLISLKTPEEMQSLLKEQGIEFTIEEIEVLREAMAEVAAKGDAGELSDKELEDVAGGMGGVLSVSWVALESQKIMNLFKEGLAKKYGSSTN